MSDDTNAVLLAEYIEAWRQVEAERDELQRRIDAYEGHLERWEEIDRLIAASSLGGEEAQRVRDSVPPQVGKALARAVQEAERADRAEDERDRLMEELRWTENTLDNVRMGMAETSAERDQLRADQMVNAEMEVTIRQLEAERDRLRAVVDAALSGLSLMAVEAKCHDDVLISADLYAALSRQLDATPTEEDT